ncbi:MAG: hypothetical protein ABIH57_01180 [Candidatus Omnitrophota bacterium]
MKKRIIIGLILVSLIVVLQVSAYAENGGSIPLNKILQKLTKSNNTSLQRLDLSNQFKGEIVNGSGRVKDVIHSFGEDNKAMVYLSKPYKSKEYEIILLADIESAETIQKGNKIKFEGNFVGTTYQTLRFENAEITLCKSWWWPF